MFTLKIITPTAKSVQETGQFTRKLSIRPNKLYLQQ